MNGLLSEVINAHGGTERWNQSEYLTTPFLLAMDGVEVEETEPWREGSETWRVLRAYFPGSIETHSMIPATASHSRQRAAPILAVRTAARIFQCSWSPSTSVTCTSRSSLGVGISAHR